MGTGGVDPGQKKLARLKARLICLDETGFMMAPLIRRTWAPRGRTPHLVVSRRSHEKVSGIGALAVSPHRHRVTLYLALHPKKNVRGPEVLDFLRQLRRHNSGHLFLLWDQGSPHKHPLVRAYLGRNPRWHPVWLPGYAPELNPQEQVWSHLKYGRLSNFAPDDVSQIHDTVRREARRVARSSSLLKALFRHSELPFRVS
jgi:transposase